MWMILLSKFFKFIPHVQMPHLAYVTSMFTGVSFVLTLMVFLPKSTEFLWLHSEFMKLLLLQSLWS